MQILKLSTDRRPQSRGCASKDAPVCCLGWLLGDKTANRPSYMLGATMIRVVSVAACSVLLAACSMSMPSMDFFRSAPPTEVLRIESEPPGADARTAEGQSCRTPCELTVPSTGEVAISFALQGYNPQTVSVRPEAPPTASYAEGAPPTRMQPNPVYAELSPLVAPKQKRKAPPPRKKTVAKRPAPMEQASPAEEPPPPQVTARPQQPAAPPSSNSSFPSTYAWPPPPPPQ